MLCGPWQRLIVCLEESLYIHNIRDMKVLHTIRETPPNPAGECPLASTSHALLPSIPRVVLKDSVPPLQPEC